MINTTEYKNRLEQLLIDITAELSTLGVHDPTTDDWIATTSEPHTGEADPNSEADTVEDWNERRATLALLETRYQNIKRGLEKIEAGTYGTCEVCDTAIDEERLIANPAARTCREHMDAESSLPLT